MFESAELGHKIPNKIYKKEMALLREALLNVQFDLAEKASFPVVIIMAGMDGAGKGETANTLLEWLDPRKINSYDFTHSKQEELQKPRMWRFWQALPPKGSMGFFFGSWYSEPMLKKYHGEIDKKTLDGQLADIMRFERMLSDEGALIIKFWLHLSKKGQKARIKSLRKDANTSWRVTETDLAHLKIYDKIKTTAAHVLWQTSTSNAPWFTIEGTDANYRNLTAGQHLLQAINARLKQPGLHRRKPAAVPLTASIDMFNILDKLDLNKSMVKSTYKLELEKYQGQLNLLMRHRHFNKISLIIGFEGMDAAGKGGSIRRITQAIDTRHYHVVPISAPSDEERAQPYLWRFWRHIPERGKLAIFDRTWYGRVLVERVDDLLPKSDWMRAYGEINDFEKQLVQQEVLLIKFWLQISPEEQLRRFEARQKIPFKRFKITDEDWHNRKQWDNYQIAVSDMIDRTSSEYAPWHLIEANDKYYARIKILKTVCEVLEKKLKQI